MLPRLLNVCVLEVMYGWREPAVASGGLLVDVVLVSQFKFSWIVILLCRGDLLAVHSRCVGGWIAFACLELGSTFEDGRCRCMTDRGAALSRVVLAT